MAVGQVAHHGARDHHAGGGGEGRDRAEDRQPADRGRQRAADAGEGEQRGADHQGDAAAEPVGERALGDLADGEAGEPGGEGELRGAGRRCGSEASTAGKAGRYMSVAAGPDGDEEAEQGGEPGGGFMEWVWRRAR